MKFFYIILSVIMISMCSSTLFSCGGDDDYINQKDGFNNKDDAPTNTEKYVGVMDSKTGLRFASLRVASSDPKTFSISYDVNGNLKSIITQLKYNTYIHSFVNMNEFISKYLTEDDESGNRSMVTYNSEGYITRINHPETSMEYKYDDNGHLVWANCSIEVHTFVWEGDNLVSVSTSYRNTNRITRTRKFFYDNPNFANKYRQFCFFFSENLTTPLDIWETLSMLGLFGKGPKYLPSKIVSTGYDKNGAISNSNTYSMCYDFNSDGTLLAMWREGNYKTFYSYDYATYVNRGK